MNTKLKNIMQFDLLNDFDNLYADSKNNSNRYNFMDLILDERNIRLAYRELKNNKGSKTFGLDGKTIADIKGIPELEVISLVRNRLHWYVPGKVRYISTPKSDKSSRKVGISNLIDRLIQQCIKQVLEPWCEARFYRHNYGARSLRNASHALSRVVSMINRGKCYYAVSFDIYDFFSNVDHYILMRSLWNFGIRDKTLLSIIKSMFSAESTKGLLQGNILSPLLANVYLTDLDKWVESQWEAFPVKGNIHSFHTKMRKRNTLKHGYIVRYVDDFLILTTNYKAALKWKMSVSKYLDERLHLVANCDKTKIINLKKKYVNFLGFKIKAFAKGKTKNGYVAKTHISDEALKRIQEDLHTKISLLQRNTYSDRRAIEYNLAIMGIKNYYKFATMVYLDLDKIAKGIAKSIRVRLGDKSKQVRFKETPSSFKEHNIGLRDNTKIYKVCNTYLHVITGVHHTNPMNFRQDMTLYSIKGRSLIKDAPELSFYNFSEAITYLLRESNAYTRGAIELTDNRISLYINRKGKSYISGNVVSVEDYHMHHKVAVKDGGNHSLSNLVLLSKDEHKLVHATDKFIIDKYLEKLRLTKLQIKKVNDLRIFLNLATI